MTVKEVLETVTKAYQKLNQVNENIYGVLHPNYMDELQEVEGLLADIPEQESDIEKE